MNGLSWEKEGLQEKETTDEQNEEKLRSHRCQKRTEPTLPGEIASELPHGPGHIQNPAKHIPRKQKGVLIWEKMMKWKDDAHKGQRTGAGRVGRKDEKIGQIGTLEAPDPAGDQCQKRYVEQNDQVDVFLCKAAHRIVLPETGTGNKMRLHHEQAYQTDHEREVGEGREHGLPLSQGVGPGGVSGLSDHGRNKGKDATVHRKEINQKIGCKSSQGELTGIGLLATDRAKAMVWLHWAFAIEAMAWFRFHGADKSACCCQM